MNLINNSQIDRHTEPKIFKPPSLKILLKSRIYLRNLHLHYSKKLFWQIRCIILKIKDPRNPCLYHFLCTHRTRISSHIQSRPSQSHSPSYNNCIFFCVDTHTFIQVFPFFRAWITSMTASSITVRHSERRPIITRWYNLLIFIHTNCPNSPFHAICPRRGHNSHSHKVLIPRRPQDFFVWKVELFKLFNKPFSFIVKFLSYKRPKFFLYMEIIYSKLNSMRLGLGLPCHHGPRSLREASWWICTYL